MHRILLSLCLSVALFPLELLACPVSTPSKSPQSTVPVQVISASQPQRPPLTAAERTELIATTQQLTTSWFDLAGLNKLIQPPPVTNELQAFRQTWQSQNPEIVPFLGTWTDDGSIGAMRSLSIFPAQTPNQVCILEYAAEVRAAPEDILSPQVLMVYPATVVNQQLQSSRLRSDRAAILSRSLAEQQTVELMGADLNDGRSWLFAATTPPAFPADFPAEAVDKAKNALVAQGCQASNLQNP